MTRRRRLGLLVFAAALSAPAGALAGGRVVALRLDPAAVSLSSADDHQSVVVQATFDDGRTEDVTEKARLRLDDEGRALLAAGVLRPLSDGTTALTAWYAGAAARAEVSVTSAAVGRDVRFETDVIPALTASGCNAGTCHGSSRGQDGFALSLFGFDPAGDWRRITLEEGSRRIHPAAPDESLLLAKAAGTVPHTGGRLWSEEGPRYRTVRRWIAEGAPMDPPETPVAVALELLPPGAVLRAGETQRLVLVARLSDGTTRDVTADAVYFSQDASCASVPETGVVTAGRRGEAQVSARYAAFTVGIPVLVVPSEADLAVASPEAAGPEPTDPIDRRILEKLARLRIGPSPFASDEEFVRRVHLDLVGLPPTVEQRAAFLEDGRPDRRERLVDRLLESDAFLDQWVMEWADMLRLRSDLTRNASPKAMLRYGEWLRERLADGVGVDVLVRELLTANGSTLADPPANFHQLETDPLKQAENVAQAFLGMRIQCAQCHDHPFDRWTMDDYYGFAAFFAEVARKSGGEPRETIVFDRGTGEVTHPIGGRAVPPRFLGGATPDTAGKDRRRVLADWLTADDNPYFARAFVNRVWARFFGRGVVEPVDDFRVSNPPSNDALLDELARGFVESGYDLKTLVRRICLTDAYRRSTAPTDSNALDDRNFARQRVRRLRAEVLYDSICAVTDRTSRFLGLPAGLRAVELDDGAATNEFLLTFGRPVRTTVCACDIVLEPNLSQALLLLNGDDVSKRIAEGDLPRRRLEAGVSPEAVLEELYLRCLSRPPDDDERRALLDAVRAAQPGHEAHHALEDVLWALLNSKEFLFNH